jgi:hypothetical protein
MSAHSSQISEWRACVVRILGPDGAIVGTGFVVSEKGLVATCAHVVDPARTGPGEEVQIVFHSTGSKVTAVVDSVGWCPQDKEDVAFLQLNDALPENVTPAILGASEGRSGVSVRAFGYRKLGDLEGIWGLGKLVGPVSGSERKRLQLAVSEITTGFSGGPVWDEETGHVLGMVTEFAKQDSYGKGQNVAFAVPIERLVELRPDDDLPILSFNAVAMVRSVPWNEVRLRCQKASHIELGTLERKYQKDELYVERRRLRREIDSFIKGERACYLVLRGRSGMGKSALLYRLAQDLSKDESIACLVFDSPEFRTTGLKADASLLDRLAEGFLDEPDSVAIKRLLDRIESADGFDSSTNRLVIIVDGINESKNMDTIVRQVASLSKERRPWIKVIMACRWHFWPLLVEEMLAYIGTGSFFMPSEVGKLYLEVPGFTEDEAAEAYEKHQRVYRFTPEEYGQLERALQKRLREPLLLWLVSKIREGRHIDIEAAGSDISVIRDYTERLLEPKYDPKEIKERMHVLEYVLPYKMVRGVNCHNTVSPNEAKNLSGNNKQIIEDFAKLGILEETGSGHIRFRYERFYDFFFGCILKELVSQGVSPDCKPEEPGQKQEPEEPGQEQK